MKTLDRILQRWRIWKVRPFVTGRKVRLLDIGCSQGELFEQLGDFISEGVGIDPLLPENTLQGRFSLLSGTFPAALPDQQPFDVITMLAVLEHIPPDDYPALATQIEQHLCPGGYLVVTVPEPVVDRILDLLLKARIIDGMSLEEHHGFEPRHVQGIFPGLKLVQWKKFQLGLNNLIVFQKASA